MRLARTTTVIAVIACANVFTAGVAPAAKDVEAQVDMEVSHVAVTLAEVENLIKRDASVTAEALVQAWKEGKGKLVGFGKVTSQPGEEATVKATVEFIYPTEYILHGAEPQFVVQGATNNIAVPQGMVMVPGGFETREVGIIVTAKPDVSRDQKTVSVLLCPDMVLDPVWHEYDKLGLTAAGQKADLSTKMPFFSRNTVSTAIRAHDGKTVIAGAAGRTAGGDVIFTLLTVNLVDLDGKPLSKKADKKP